MIPDSSVTSEYLGYFFKVFNKYVLDLTVKHSTTVQSINTYEFERLNIPVPPLEIQEKIVDSLDTVYAAKHEKEAEAKRLLESVDAYVLERLGIRLPAATDNALATRTFYRNSGEVLGGRFDAPSHSSKLSLESDSFPMVRFRDHVDINPRMSLAHLSDETPLSFVPMESISDLYGEITGTQTRVAGEAKGYTLFREGDILWAKITPCMQNGKSAIAENLLNGFGYGSTEYHVFRASNGELNQSYIFALLRLKYLRNEGVKFFSGSAGH